MADDNLTFSAPVRSTRYLPRTHTIRTIGKAIDFLIFELPEARQGMPHWERAKAFLYEAYGPPPDPSKVGAAEEAFRAAMKEEGWL